VKKIIVIMLLVLTLSSCWPLDWIKEKKMQKARDASRIASLQSIKAGLYMAFSDNAEYPKTLEWIKTYLITIPKDPKDWKIINGCKFWYTYEVFADKSKIENSAFRISACLEDSNNIKSKAKNDGWIYDNKFEITSF